eukprot:m.345026 g.345026  ORF g.345026 m.345026 type:complete len:382 (+) comp25680_c0_seq1:131-1276(+)
MTQTGLIVLLFAVGGMARSPRHLPKGPLIVGYAPGSCDENQHQIIEEAEKGVNVIIWFATILIRNATTGLPQIQGGPNNHTCVAAVAQELRRRQLPTAHMISIGGWDAPHPNTSFTGKEWFKAWEKWNLEEISNPSLAFPGYDGIDWDLEGNDNQESQWNVFTVECMELVGTMSQAAKSNGYLVSLVPPQSYTDYTTSKFDLSLRHSYENWHPDFPYRGMNAYAIWLSDKYGKTPEGIPTFDFVDIQLYESWSRASFAIDGPPQIPAATYLVELVRAYQKGWTVNFSTNTVLNVSTQHIHIPATQLVIGFSRGSDDKSGKSVFIWPKDVGKAWSMLSKNERPLGVMFWNMVIDGTPVNGTNISVNQAAEFNDFLHVRLGSS